MPPLRALSLVRGECTEAEEAEEAEEEEKQEEKERTVKKTEPHTRGEEK